MYNTSEIVTTNVEEMWNKSWILVIECRTMLTLVMANYKNKIKCNNIDEKLIRSVTTFAGWSYYIFQLEVLKFIINYFIVKHDQFQN